MAKRRIASAWGTGVVTAIFLSGLFPAVAAAQGLGRLRQPVTDSAVAVSLSQDAGVGGGETVATDSQASEEKKDDLDLLDMDLKQLSQVAVKSGSPTMDMEVSTVSRTDSTVARSPAAVYVVTNDMIKRSGARNIPEVLRLVPGVNVARITTSSWAISIRGFNGHFSNKLLVQIDGHDVYTPGFGGIWWDMQQVLLEDVERIEVIRGPGGSVWGSNAVNGVINIITKSSADTGGIYAYSGGGNEHRSFNGVRTGGQQGDFHWRTYGMQADDSPGYWQGPGGAWDAYQYTQGGFRTDWTPTSRDTLTLQGDFLGTRSTANQNWGFGFFPGPERTRGSNFLGRWERKIDEDSDWAVQLYYDNWHRRVGGIAPQLLNQNTFDLDTQRHIRLGDRHNVVCGFGYRNYEMEAYFSGVGGAAVVPPVDSLGIISYFVEDTIMLREDLLYATFGVKFEHNTYTNFEYQPCAKLLLTPDEKTSMWGSISRAVRTPSMAERSGSLLGGLIQGSQSLTDEDVLAYELGMRRQATERLYWDLAVFFNRYDSLIGLTPGFPMLVASNVGRGDTYGYELAVTYNVTADWYLRSAYTFFVEDITYGPTGLPLFSIPGRTPRNQCTLQSGWNLSKSSTLDMIWRYVDSLENGNLPSYLVMDIRWARDLGRGLEVAVMGRDLFDSPHPEFIDNLGEATEVQASVWGMVSWRY